ncbi:hypothetical protein POTOM_062077 [Populus tomentosa]|uniref:WDHD1/CFT4 second beta-propeller domain-containing protein n=1 Tax=Populus tomentosa TaxID=118781 RepID=A0A8X7XNE2_POPTO|nr:hypothetical protein POTOM_062077 [Populus tomentosa]
MIRSKVHILNVQMLGFRVFDIGPSHIEGRLPLIPGSHLPWFGFGFSEEGQLSSYDSKQILWGVLRVFTSQYYGLVLFHEVLISGASKEKKSDESYWVVGLNVSMLFCIVCKRLDMFPR